MNITSLKKKVAMGLVATSLFVLASCGGPTSLPKADPKDVLKSARENFVVDTLKSLEDQLVGASSAKIDLDATFPQGNVKGTIGLDAETKSGKQATDPSSMAAKITANIQGTVEKIMGSAELALEVKAIDKILYLNLDKFDVKSDDANVKESIAQAKAFLESYSKKWFKLDTEALSQQMGGTQVYKQNSFADAEKALSLVKNYEVFDVIKELPEENGMYVYQVKPNIEGTIALVKALVELTPAKTEWTANDEAGLKEVLTELGNEKVTHTLYIDGTTKKYKKLLSKGNADGSEVSGTVDVAIMALDQGGVEMSVKANLADKVDTKKTVVLSFNMKGSSASAGTVALSIDAPNENIKIAINGSSTFQKKDVTIQAPEGASDLAQMLSAFGLIGGKDDVNAKEMPASTKEEKPSTETNVKADEEVKK